KQKIFLGNFSLMDSTFVNTLTTLLKLILTIWLILLSLETGAQEMQRQINISGCVVTKEAGEAVADAKIIVRKGYVGAILAYRSTSQNGCFNFNINFQIADSLFLFISHSFLETDTTYLNTTNESALALGNIRLSPQKNL